MSEKPCSQIVRSLFLNEGGMRPPLNTAGFETSLWTFDLLVIQGVRPGWMACGASIETMRQALSRAGISFLPRAHAWQERKELLHVVEQT